MPWEALDTPGELGRLRDIAAVLIRHGFGDVVQRIGMAAALERAGKVLGRTSFKGTDAAQYARSSTLRPGGSGPNLRQARPGSGNPRRSPSCGMDRRAQ